MTWYSVKYIFVCCICVRVYLLVGWLVGLQFTYVDGIIYIEIMYIFIIFVSLYISMFIIKIIVYTYVRIYCVIIVS